MSGARVLVVDDEPEVRRALRTSLGGRGYDVQLAANGEPTAAYRAAKADDIWGAVRHFFGQQQTAA